MVWVRSRRETGDDARFLSIQDFQVPDDSLHYWMSVAPCRVFRPEDEILYSSFLGFIAPTMGFLGEGTTLSDTADDTCRKLVSYIEHRVRGGLPPHHHAELHMREFQCWGEYDQHFAEQDFERHEGKGEMEWDSPTDLHGELHMRELQDFERHEGRGEMEFGIPTDFYVFAQLLEGTVNQVGWQEKGSSSWYVWKMPVFSSLD